MEMTLETNIFFPEQSVNLLSLNFSELTTIHHFIKQFYTEFHENPTSDIAADTMLERAHMQEYRDLHIRCFVLNS